eukprot:Skav227509  [mRNA]  locus=scaffold282:276428:281225:+ [translate_table: standard]
MGLSEYAASLAVRTSRRAAGQGLFTTRSHKAGSLLLAVPAGRVTSPELRELQAASIGNDHYQLPQAMSPEDALHGVVLEEEHREHRAAFAALLSDPRQWRSISAPRRLATGEAELRSSELFFSLAKLTRAPTSEAFSIHGLINHSCEPNVQRSFVTSERPWLLLRAAEDLQADEELMDSYFFPLVPLEERHRNLARLGPKATFKCHCARCLAEEPMESHEAKKWSELKRLLIQLALLRGKGLQGAEVAGIKDPFLLQSSAEKLLWQLQHVLTPDRLSSPSWVVGAAILADLQVAVQGNFAAAEETLGLAMGSLKPGSAARLELAAVRCSYAATRRAVHGDDQSSGACAELKKCLELCGSSLSGDLPPLHRYLDQLAVRKRRRHGRSPQAAPAEERVLNITYYPLAVFRVRPVTRCTSSLSGHIEAVLCVSFSPDSSKLASGSGDSTVRIWDLNTELPKHTCHLNWVLAVAWSPDGSRLASAGMDKIVLVWCAQSGKNLGANELKGHGHWVNTLALNTDYVIRSGPYSHEPAKFKDLAEKKAREGKEAAKKRYAEAIELLGSMAPAAPAEMGAQLCGGERLLSGSDDFTLFLWRPLAPGQHNFAKKALTVPLVAVASPCSQSCKVLV